MNQRVKRNLPVILFTAAAFIIMCLLILSGGTSSHKNTFQNGSENTSRPDSLSGERKDGEKPDQGEETEEEGSEKIIFQGTRIASSHSAAVHVDANKVTILKGGIYTLKGNLTDGQIIVDAGPEDEVVLKFNNLTAHCSDSSPMWIRRAGKVKIRLRDDSENRLSDGSYYRMADSEKKQPRACIDARCDLNIRGPKGSLTVKAAYRDGIRSSDDLKIKSGTIQVEAPRHGLVGKDSVQIEDGDLEIRAGRDGIHSDGFLMMQGGQARIRAGWYGLYAYEELQAKPPGRIILVSALSRAGCRGTIDLGTCLVESESPDADEKRRKE